MKQLILFLLIFFAGTCVKAQDHKVPGRMTVAGIDLRINDAARKSIQEDVDALTQSEKYWEIKAERARTYFPIIERIFREEGIPDDIKYLVLQESALIADAVSTSNAVGYWQMKDFTAVELGLRVDRHVDERKNIVASTYGAAKYLNRSNEIFDNWLNALQSYQMGITGAEKALGFKDKGSKSMTITMRTYWYVRKFLAHYVAYNDVLDKPAEKPVMEYPNAAGMSINEIARETKVSPEEIKELNIWLRHSRVPDDKSYTMILPASGEYIPVTTRANESVEKAPVLKDMSSEFPRIKENRFREHKYIIGVNGLPGIIASESDDMESLAEKGDISVNRFIKFNDLKATEQIIPGQVYYFKRKKRKAGTHYHTLQPGEDTWVVSQKYGIRLKQLLTKNRIENGGGDLKPGRVLWLRFIRPEDIPVVYSEITVNPEEVEIISSSEVVSAKGNTEEVEVVSDGSELDTGYEYEELEEDNTEPFPEDPPFDPTGYTRKVHSVVQGQTYYGISQIYSVSVLDLLEWNELSIHDKLSIGQKLIIYVTSETEVANEKFHEVKPGETLYSISKIYSVSVQDLLEWNNRSDHSLRVGEKIRVKAPN